MDERDPERDGPAMRGSTWAVSESGSNATSSRAESSTLVSGEWMIDVDFKRCLNMAVYSDNLTAECKFSYLHVGKAWMGVLSTMTVRQPRSRTSAFMFKTT